MSKKLKIEKEKQGRKWRIFNCSNPVFEGEMLSGPHTEIFGNEKITVDGCLGVFEYTETYIKLRLSKGALILCGNRFDIAFFENELITIRGKISSVEFCL